MKSVSLQTSIEKLPADLENLDVDNQILFLFTSSENIRQNDIYSMVKKHLPEVTLIGCSTYGEIGETFEEGMVSFLAIQFEKTPFKCATFPIDSIDHSYNAGKELAEKVNEDDLTAVFVLIPGLGINGSQFTNGVRDALPEGIAISGGMASDGTNFKETYTLLNGEISPCNAVILALYGSNVKVHTASRGGWRPFGPERRVTRSKDNMLYEIDGEPALDLYKKYIGDKVSNLPAGGLLYPFAIVDDENRDNVGIVRSVLDIDEENKGLFLCGDVDVGQRICLMYANTEDLVAGAREAAKHVAVEGEMSDGDAVICVSCFGRRVLMGDDTEDEIDVIKDVFKGQAISGFYSYGEICPFVNTGRAELHNQTMTITHIHEEVD